MSNFTLGSDPEVLLVDKDGEFISAVGLIGGSKMNPMQTPHGWVQEDNVLVEFNTVPATTRDMFITNTLDMLKDIDEIITPLDLSVCIESSGLFDQEQLLSHQAQTAGCEPDFNAWLMSMNEPPSLSATQLRTCGGHLHIAFDRAKESDTTRAELVRVMDLVAGVPSVLMDEDVERRSLYGQAGAHRPKYEENNDPYDGVEYRTLSNFWLKGADRIGWAYDVVAKAVNNFDELLKIANSEQKVIVEAINTSNKEMAEALTKEYNLQVA